MLRKAAADVQLLASLKGTFLSSFDKLQAAVLTLYTRSVRLKFNAKPTPKAAMRAAATRTRVINLRTDERRRALIDRAAEALGKDRTEFMLDAATREAQSVLLDRQFFQLDAAAFRRFLKALDAPPSENPRLRQLLAKPAPWER